MTLEFDLLKRCVRNKRIVCKDGVSLSIQTGDGMYCTPRDSEGPWSTVEVGFIQDEKGEPHAAPRTWIEYAERPGVHSDIYGYIPVELVAAFIDLHGGIDTLAMLKQGWWRI